MPNAMKFVSELIDDMKLITREAKLHAKGIVWAIHGKT